MPASWRAVFHLPSWPAAITSPSLAATCRSPFTMNSRESRTITIHAGTRPRRTIMINAAATISLSAIGSSSFPVTVIMFHRRARKPSTTSVTAAMVKTEAAITEYQGSPS